MIRFFAVLISFFLFFSEAYIPPYEYRDEENIRFSAVILSDMHTETNSNARFLMDGYTLKGVYSGGRSPDVLAFAGDNTMNGQSVEWFDFYGLVNRYNKSSDVLVAFGNHDFGNTADGEVYKKLSKRSVDSYNYYCRKNIDKVYYGCTIEDNAAIGFRDEQFDQLAGGRETLTDYLVCIDREACLELFEFYQNMEHRIY